ncbi:MAG: SUKH-3 domain-containing protein [Planctomycetales bacterium]
MKADPTKDENGHALRRMKDSGDAPAKSRGVFGRLRRAVRDLWTDRILREAGWSPGRRVDLEIACPALATYSPKIVEALRPFLAEFHGLMIVPPDQDYGCDLGGIRDPFDTHEAEAWKPLIGDYLPIGWIGLGSLIANEQGTVYACDRNQGRSETTGETPVWFIADDPYSAIEVLLWEPWYHCNQVGMIDLSNPWLR